MIGDIDELKAVRYLLVALAPCRCRRETTGPCPTCLNTRQVLEGWERDLVQKRDAEEAADAKLVQEARAALEGKT